MKALIIKGINSTDELPRFGIVLAKKYFEANLVIFVSDDCNYRIMKFSGGKADLEYIDIIDLKQDSADGDIN